MAKDSGFVLQGYIRVDIYRKNTEYSRQKTGGGMLEYWKDGMMAEW